MKKTIAIACIAAIIAIAAMIHEGRQQCKITELAAEIDSLNATQADERAKQDARDRLLCNIHEMLEQTAYTEFPGPS